MGDKTETTSETVPTPTGEMAATTQAAPTIVTNDVTPHTISAEGVVKVLDGNKVISHGTGGEIAFSETPTNVYFVFGNEITKWKVSEDHKSFDLTAIAARKKDGSIGKFVDLDTPVKLPIDEKGEINVNSVKAEDIAKARKQAVDETEKEEPGWLTKNGMSLLIGGGAALLGGMLMGGGNIIMLLLLALVAFAAASFLGADGDKGAVASFMNKGEEKKGIGQGKEAGGPEAGKGAEAEQKPSTNPADLAAAADKFNNRNYVMLPPEDPLEVVAPLPAGVMGPPAPTKTTLVGK
jgi:hypothetical protein